MWSTPCIHTYRGAATDAVEIAEDGYDDFGRKIVSLGLALYLPTYLHTYPPTYLRTYLQ